MVEQTKINNKEAIINNQETSTGEELKELIQSTDSTKKDKKLTKKEKKQPETKEDSLIGEKPDKYKKIKNSFIFLVNYIKNLEIKEKSLQCKLCGDYKFLSSTEEIDTETFMEKEKFTNIFAIGEFYSKALVCFSTHRTPIYTEGSNFFQNVLKLELYILSYLNYSSNINFHISEKTRITHDIYQILVNKRFSNFNIKSDYIKTKLENIGKINSIDTKLHIHCLQSLESIMYRVMRYNCCENPRDNCFLRKMSPKEINALFFILYSRKEHFRFQRLYKIRKNEVGNRLNLLLSLESLKELSFEQIIDDYNKQTLKSETEKMFDEMKTESHEDSEFIYKDVGINYSKKDVKCITPVTEWFKQKERRVYWISAINSWKDNRCFAVDVSMIKNCINFKHFKEGLLIFESLNIFSRLDTKKVKKGSVDISFGNDCEVEMVTRLLIFTFDCAIGGLVEKYSTVDKCACEAQLNSQNEIDFIDSQLKKLSVSGNKKIEENYFFVFFKNLLKKINDPEIKKAINIKTPKNLGHIICESMKKIFLRIEELGHENFEKVINEIMLCITQYGLGDKDSVVNVLIKGMSKIYHNLEKENNNEENSKKMVLLAHSATKIYNIWQAEKKANKKFLEYFVSKKISAEVEEIFENILYLSCDCCTRFKENDNCFVSKVCKDIRKSKLVIDHTIRDSLCQYHNNIAGCSCGLFMKKDIDEEKFSKLCLDHLCELSNK